MKEKLKPCVRCGAKAEIHQFEACPDHPKGRFCIWCKTDNNIAEEPCYEEVSADTREEAVAKWNQRHVAPNG